MPFNPKRLLADKLYFPFAGVNFDAQGLYIGENEFTDVENLRVLKDSLVVRDGCRRIADNTPSGDPILHFHKYKAADGTEILFGFTKNAVYKYQDSTEQWINAYATYAICDLCEVATDWASDVDTVLTTVNNVYEGDYCLEIDWVNVRPPAGLPAGSVVFGKSGVGAMDWDLHQCEEFVFWLKTEVVYEPEPSPLIYDMDLLVRFYSNDDLTGLLEEHEITVSYDSVQEEWTEYVITLDDPSLLSSVQSFSIVTVDEYTRGGGKMHIDYLYGRDDFNIDPLVFPDGITNWSTTEFTDTNIGTTVVAAGSIPPNPTEGEEDGDVRVLIYYDNAYGFFRPLVQRSISYVERDEEIGASGSTHYTGSFARIADDFQVSNEVHERATITDGNETFTDNGLGVMLSDKVGGTNGTLDYETGAYDVTFASTTTEDVTADYFYYEPLEWKPRFVYNFHNRLVGVNVYDGSNYLPWTIFWSAVADITIFDITKDWVDRLDSDTSPFVGGAFINKTLMLFRENSIEAFYYVGGSNVFGYQTVWQDGTYAGRTVTAINNRILYLGKDDIMMFDGSNAQGIGIDRIRNELFGDLSSDRIKFCFGGYYPKYNEYWLWIVKTGETYPSTVYVYNILLNAWTRFVFQETPAMGRYHTKTGVTIDELIGTIDEQNWKLGDSLLDGLSEAIVISRYDSDTFVLDGRLCSDYGYDTDGTWTSDPIPWLFASRDFTYEDPHRQDRTTRMQFEALGGEVTVEYSRDYGRSWQHPVAIILEPAFSENRYWLDSVKEVIRYRFTGTTQDQFFAFRWLQTFAVAREKD